MAGTDLIPERGRNITVEERVELVMDLTRKLCLLEDLLLTAANQRDENEVATSLADLNLGERDALARSSSWIS